MRYKINRIRISEDDIAEVKKADKKKKKSEVNVSDKNETKQA